MLYINLCNSPSPKTFGYYYTRHQHIYEASALGPSVNIVSKEGEKHLKRDISDLISV